MEINELEKIGFSLILDFISLEEEIELMNNIKKFPPKKTKSRNSIQRFGSALPYKSNIINNKIPSHFNFILDRLVEKKLVENRPNSVSINEYLEGQEITPHIDSKSSGPIITVLSLLSDAIMVFQNKNKKAEVLLPNRSIIQIKEEIRYNWQHSIKPVNNTRYSIVFRYGT